MANKNSTSIWRELLKTGLYKRNQGRLTRQLTALSVILIVCYGTWTLSNGLLSDYVNSFWTVKVVYEPEQLSGSRLAELTQLAEEQGGSLSSEASHPGGRREVEIRFTTSEFWSTSEELQAAMHDKADNFRSAAEERFAGLGSTKDRPRVTGLSHRVQRATAISVGIPLILAGLGVWVAYRLVNYPRFADFLISVEAEMDKVSWASRQELHRATMVVVSTMFFLGFVLLMYDVFWQWLFRLIGFLQI